MFLGLNVVDWLLVALALVVGYSGWLHGFVVGLLSFIGFIGGTILGVLLVPPLLGGFEPGLGVSVLAVLLVLGLASIGQALLAWGGGWVRSTYAAHPVSRIDAAAGTVFGVAGLLVAAWVAGLVVSSAAIPHASAAVRESRILALIDDAAPVSPDRLRTAFEDVIVAGGFPEVVGPWVHEPIFDVAAPDQTLHRDPDVQLAAESVVKIVGRAPECESVLEGSGFVIAPERVMTNAHVVAGVPDPVVTFPGSEPLAAEVVLFDPASDVAVLAVPGLALPALDFAAQPPEAGADAVVVGYPNNGPLDAEPVRVRGSHQLLGRDIYGDSQVTRDVLSLRGEVRPGNSGGPLVSTDGTVYGVVFAASLTDPDTGYALAHSEVADMVEQAPQSTEPVTPGHCG